MASGLCWHAICPSFDRSLGGPLAFHTEITYEANPTSPTDLHIILLPAMWPLSIFWNFFKILNSSWPELDQLQLRTMTHLDTKKPSKHLFHWMFLVKSFTLIINITSTSGVGELLFRNIHLKSILSCSWGSSCEMVCKIPYEKCGKNVHNWFCLLA